MRIPAVALLAGIVATSAATAAAQAPATKPPSRAPDYDPKAEVTITGVVDDSHTSKLRADHPGLHLLVTTATESLEVHTCPIAFLKDMEFAVAKGDAVSVVGSRPGGGPIVVAREVRKGQTSLTVRDKNGAPLWVR